MPNYGEATIPAVDRDAVIAMMQKGEFPLPKVHKMGAAVAYTAPIVGKLTVVALTDNSIIALPAAADAPGMEITVINEAATTAALVSVSPEATDAVNGSCTLAASVVASGTTGVGVANKDWDNTKGTMLTGDYVTLVSDGVLTWNIVACQGIWASES